MPAPATGHPEIDAALSAVAGLDGLPLPEHLGRLTTAHERLDGVLRRPVGPTSEPGSGGDRGGH